MEIKFKVTAFEVFNYSTNLFYSIEEHKKTLEYTTI